MLLCMHIQLVTDAVCALGQAAQQDRHVHCSVQPRTANVGRAPTASQLRISGCQAEGIHVVTSLNQYSAAFKTPFANAARPACSMSGRVHYRNSISQCSALICHCELYRDESADQDAPDIDNVAHYTPEDRTGDAVTCLLNHLVPGSDSTSGASFSLGFEADLMARDATCNVRTSTQALRCLCMASSVSGCAWRRRLRKWTLSGPRVKPTAAPGMRLRRTTSL